MARGSEGRQSPALVEFLRGGGTLRFRAGAFGSQTGATAFGDGKETTSAAISARLM